MLGVTLRRLSGLAVGNSWPKPFLHYPPLTPPLVLPFLPFPLQSLLDDCQQVLSEEITDVRGLSTLPLSPLPYLTPSHMSLSLLFTLFPC